MTEHKIFVKLGDVASFSRGLTYAKKDVADKSSKKVLRSNNIDLSTHTLNYEEIAYLKEDFNIPNEKKLHKGDIFICMSNGSTQHLGKVAYINEDIDYAFGGFMGVIHPDIKQLIPKYAFYACLSSEYRRFLASILNGININNLKWSELSKYTIPYPSLKEQQRIVDSLDLLTESINKQQLQLKQLEVLAQSIYYDMFGTTIHNNKGWVIKKLGDVGTFQRGGGFLKSDFVEAGCPCLHYGQIHTKLGVATYNHLTCIPKDLADSKSKYAQTGDIILAITSEDVEGSCKCTAWMGNYPIAVGAHTAIFHHTLNPIYASFFFKSAHFQKEKERYTHGFKVVEIKPSDIANINICIPPLSLQESFAEKINIIESQKSIINRSIIESQLLFDCTMDKYFS